MPLTYTKHEKVSLKTHPEFDEQWLQKQISEDPTILGLGDVDLVDRERNQGQGRLDLLFSDQDLDRRYEVELMLGATDPSHIIRTIEYWDIERRRYPAYEHVAVLVAENITSRFLNVLSLFSGSIPLICIQFSALKVNDHILLDFVKVLDQTELRVDDEAEGAKTPADRAFWESKRPREIMALVDAVGGMINEFCEKKHTLNYTRSHIGLSDGLRTRNFVVFHPRKGHLRLGVELSNKDAFDDSLADAGVDFKKGGKRISLSLSPAEFESVNDVVRRIIGQAVKDYQS